MQLQLHPGPTSPVSWDWSDVGSASSLNFIYCPSLSGRGQQDKFERYCSRVSSFASFILGGVDKLKKSAQKSDLSMALRHEHLYQVATGSQHNRRVGKLSRGWGKIQRTICLLSTRAFTLPGGAGNGLPSSSPETTQASYQVKGSVESVRTHHLSLCWEQGMYAVSAASLNDVEAVVVCITVNNIDAHNQCNNM